MPPKRSLRAPRQTKLDFSPKPTRTRATTTPSSSSPAQVSKKRKLDRETERGMKLGSPVKNSPLGMFGSSDVEVFSGDSSSESENMEPPPRKRRGKAAVQRRLEPVRAPTRERRSKAFVVPQEVSSESEDEIPPRSQRTRRRARSPEEEDDDSDELEELEELPARSPAKGRRGPRKMVELASDEEEEEEADTDEDDVPRSTQRRRASKARELDPQEQEDLHDDLEFLQSSPPADKGGLRSRHTKPLSQREKTLQALIQKRRASSGGEPPSSATPGRKRAIVLDDSDDSLEIIPEEDDEQLEEVDDEIVEEDDEEYSEDDGAETHDTNALDMFHQDDNDEEFIDDDDGGNLIGAPADLTAIPIEFTSLSRAKPKELFKYAVEWMVHKKLNPAFPRTDEVYTLAFRKLDDEVQGLANSKYSSSAWGPDFTRAIRARPDVMFSELTSFQKEVQSPHCEACNRRTHQASWEVSLTGHPYNKDTLEPLADNSDSSDCDSSSLSSDSEAALNGEKPLYDALGHRIPPTSKTFSLGSHCKLNAATMHTLYHWRYHLNSWVVDHLTGQGKFSKKEVLKREKLSERKRTKYANKVVDQMEKDGEIKTLYRLYKAQLDEAMETKNEYRGRWGAPGTN